MELVTWFPLKHALQAKSTLTKENRCMNTHLKYIRRDKIVKLWLTSWKCSDLESSAITRLPEWGAMPWTAYPLREGVARAEIPNFVWN